MKCCEQLDDYLDGDLGPLEREAFLRAAAACSECQAAMETARTLNQTLRTAWHEVRLPEPETTSIGPEDMSRVVKDEQPLARSKPETHNGSWWNRSTTRWSIAIACSLLLMLVGWSASRWWTHARDHSSINKNQLTSNNPQTNQGSPNTSTEPQSSVVAQQYDNSDLEIGGPYIGYKAVDNDDFTLVMVYRIPDEQLANEPEPNSSAPTTDFD